MTTDPNVQLTCGLCACTPSESCHIFDFESCSGKWQSACHHAACLTCLRGLVESQASRCEADGQLRIICFDKACRKHVPQSLVFSVSYFGRALADSIDNGTALKRESCSVCGKVTLLLVNDACGHKACEACCEAHASTYAGHLALPCWDPVCRLASGGPSEVPQKFWAEEFPFHPLTPILSKTPHVVEHYPFIVRNAAPAEPGPICPVCRERVVALIVDEGCPRDCSHAACVDCWKRWGEEQLDACFATNSVAIRCVASGCGRIIGQQLWQYITPSEATRLRPSRRIAAQEGCRPHEVRQALSAGLAARQGPLTTLRLRLERRAKLQQNQLFPPSLQVNCPRWNCVGLGYLGYDTVMCFICEHQWIPADGAGEAPAEVDPEVVMGVAVKRCPKCNEHIEKNGGCDHMTCRCKHEFYWSTLKPYKPG